MYRIVFHQSTGTPQPKTFQLTVKKGRFAIKLVWCCLKHTSEIFRCDIFPEGSKEGLSIFQGAVEDGKLGMLQQLQQLELEIKKEK